MTEAVTVCTVPTMADQVRLLAQRGLAAQGLPVTDEHVARFLAEFSAELIQTLATGTNLISYGYVRAPSARPVRPPKLTAKPPMEL